MFLKHSPKLTSGHSTATARRSDVLGDGNVRFQFHSELLLKPEKIRTDTSPPFVNSVFKYFRFAKSLRQLVKQGWLMEERVVNTM
jgi:hypothetical protein